MAGHDHSRVALSDTAMSTVRRSLVAILVLAASLPGQTLKQIATIDLPRPKGQRFDYLTTDDEDHYLLSAHLGPGILYVIDMRTLKLVKAVPGVPGITGLEYRAPANPPADRRTAAGQTPRRRSNIPS